MHQKEKSISSIFYKIMIQGKFFTHDFVIREENFNYNEYQFSIMLLIDAL